MVSMKRQWEASDPIETLFGQINDANEYSIFARSPLQEHDLIQAAEMLILKTGQFAQEYKDWQALPDATRTWQHFQDWWQQAYNLKEETNITATDYNYSANVIDTTPQENDDGDSFVDSLSQFGEAFAANSSVISQLSEANNTMNTTMQGNIQTLTDQLESMNNAIHQLALNAHNNNQHSQQQTANARGRGRGGRGGRTYTPQNMNMPPQGAYNNFPPAPPQQGQHGRMGPFQPMPPQPFQYSPNPLYAQSQQYGQPRQYGRRNQRRQNFRPPLQPFGFPPQQQNVANPYKRHNNWNYCWTHGHDIKDGHTSQTCLAPAQGHVWYATKQNTCGGSTRGQHKIMYPLY